MTVVASATSTVDFDLPATGALRVNASDESGAPIPARVTVVGFDPSPEATVAGPALPGFGSSRQGVLLDTSDVLPFGIAAVGYTDAAGTVEFPLEPGVSLYHVFVSRGTEYSAFRTASPVTIAAGSTTVVNAQIARVLDTSGFVSSDFHVHGIRSADSRVSDVHRVQSYSAEGVENVIMTDHHVHTDLRPAIADAGLGDLLTATIGEEITSFDYGHWNAYPLLIDPNSPHATYSADGATQLSGGSTDWAQAAPPGQDFPSHGALNATPAQIIALATGGALSTPDTTIQINHISSHFQPLKIDTSLVPPRDLMTDTERANRRLPSTAAVPNLFAALPRARAVERQRAQPPDRVPGAADRDLDEPPEPGPAHDLHRRHRLAHLHQPEHGGRALLDRLADATTRPRSTAPTWPRRSRPARPWAGRACTCRRGCSRPTARATSRTSRTAATPR